MLTFANYQHYTKLFGVERELIRHSIAVCEPLVIEALDVYAQRYLWRGELPVYPVMTTPQDNGGWGHLMPLWFKPHERPIPFCALSNWGLFALVYAHSFGLSDEAEQLAQQVFTVENLARVVVGTNLQLPFLPTTQGRGRFFRNGMLPFLLSILWLDEETRRAWLRLHQLGAQHFIETQRLASCAEPTAVLTELEYAIFGRLERNTITTDEAVAEFLENGSAEAPSLLNLYQALFGAIGLGVTALAAYYRDKPLEAWREWILTEITMPYRMPDYGIEAIKGIVRHE
jgi:hypothetical protein